MTLDQAINSPLFADPVAKIFMRDSVVQRFEYTYELARNILRKVLEQEFEESGFTVKTSYRLAGKYKIIDNVEAWFEYHEARNNTSHRYYEPIAEQTYEVALNFAKDVKILLNRLEEILDA